MRRLSLKQEIETKVLPDMEARLNNKIDAISKIVENKKAKNHCQCIWKGTPIIGTYGGREIILPTPRTCSKMIFFNRFQGIKEDKFFNKLTILQQVGSIEEFTHC